MSRRVFLHLGLPKTGTTYLQTIAWEHRAALRDRGLLLPGRGPREHLWAGCAVREEPRLERRHVTAPGAWDRLVDELAQWPQDGLVTHEFFAGASGEQAARAVADLTEKAGAEVHLVITVREIVAQVTGMWQEWVKNGATGDLDHYPPRDDARPGDEWGWATLDLGGVLARWTPHLPPERVHVLCPPESGERLELWRRFAAVLGVDPDPVGAEPTGTRANESLGLVAVELLRRVNPHLRFDRPVDRGVWIRSYLAAGVLSGRGDERYWPAPERVAELRARGEAGIAALEAGGYDVIGSLAALHTPSELEPRRHPGEVTEAELLDAASATIADLVLTARSQAGRVAPADSTSGTLTSVTDLARRATRRVFRTGQ